LCGYLNAVDYLANLYCNFGNRSVIFFNVRFEWDKEKERQNIARHGVSFLEAREAFDDPNRIVLADSAHSTDEPRMFCLGRAAHGILTVRYTLRADEAVRIIGAGYWRKGQKRYEAQN
jgi:uncharacterized DUF497 family protein